MTDVPPGPRAGPLCILGLGAVGRTLATELVQAGYAVRAWSRRLERGGAHAEPPEVRCVAELAEAVRGARALLFCVRDGAITELGRRVSSVLARDARPIALHTSGYAGPESLAPLGATGVMHPLTALPRDSDGKSRRLRGVWFATSGAAPARALARELIDALGGHELPLADGADAQAHYHAAAALLSNGLVALFDAALAVSARATTDPAAMRAALATLLAATSDNLQGSEPRAALTGPIARGDVEVVRGHLQHLERLPEARELYRVLGRRLVGLARAAGGVDADRLAELARMLGD